jgi:hypothetical protein
MPSRAPKSPRNEPRGGLPGGDVFDFVLTAEQLAAIDGLDTGIRGGPELEDVTREKFGRDIPEA